MRPRPESEDRDYRGCGKLVGKVALITGGDSGIGRAVAIAFVKEGAAVSISYLNEHGDAEDTRRRIEDLGGRCLLTAGDVGHEDFCRKIVEDTFNHFGRLDILVNNAGVGAAGDISANDDDEWHRVFDVNVRGLARVSAASLPMLRRSPSAAIVNTCSVVATVGLPNRALYTATKGAVASLTRAMAADHLGDGIRVNAVSPGTADTPWVARLLAAAGDPAGAEAALVARQPMGRLVTAQEVAHAICYLASPLSASTTGSILVVDGGLEGLRVPSS